MLYISSNQFIYMSCPAASFSKLSIVSRMRSSRSNRRGHSRGIDRCTEIPDEELSSSGERVSEEDEGGNLEERNDEEEKSAKGDEGETLEEDTAQISQRNHIYAVDHCRQHEAYAFQITDAELTRCSIRIKESGRPCCTCDEEGTCRHIFWLLSQFNLDSAGGSQGHMTRTYQHIATVGLGVLCKRLNWELREGPSSPAETRWKIEKDHSESDSPRQTRRAAGQRSSAVRDILAALSLIPTEDYQPECFSHTEDIENSDLFVRHNLESTITRLLLADNDMFYRFQNLVSPDDRAISYFRNMERKARNCLDSLDLYCEKGPQGGQHNDLIWCAQSLSDIVNSVSANVAKRQPLKPSSRQEAAQTLVNILGLVVDGRNHDVYQGIQWPRRRPHGEPQIDRNLYQRLIGSPSQTNPAGRSFVLKSLQDLPEAQSYVDELERILELLRSIAWSAPKSYLDKLSGIIAQLKGGPIPSLSSGKRAASPVDRRVKRMK